MSENLQTNRKIGVIGDKDSVLGFMAVGFRVFMTDDPKKAAEILENAIDSGFAVMYITEDLLAEIPESYENIKPNQCLPSFPFRPKRALSESAWLTSSVRWKEPSARIS